LSRSDATVPPSGAPAAPAGPGRAFAAPWEAEAFALTVALHDAGVFAWPEWTAALGGRLAEGAADGGDYFVRWLEALEALLAERGLAAPEEVATLAAAWRRAARATPHGQPIRLENDPGPG